MDDNTQEKPIQEHVFFKHPKLEVITNIAATRDKVRTSIDNMRHSKLAKKDSLVQVEDLENRKTKLSLVKELTE